MTAQSSLWEVPTYRLVLTQAEVERVLNVLETSDKGGWGSFLQDLSMRIEGTWKLYELELTDAELRRVDAYAESGDGRGGFQAMFRMLRSAAWRAKWPGVAHES